ncbi:MAG TPA: M24 family metallopeptidase [Chloroflexota bacterium]|nr:M24 family metallopeptidase [Chloroflexota bacterium]
MAYWEHRDVVQRYLADQGWRGWLLMDFRGSNPLLWQVLGRGAEGGHLTRRTFLWIPTRGHTRAADGAGSAGSADSAGEEVMVLVHAIEQTALVDRRWTVRTYHDRASLQQALTAFGLAGGTVAMEYSPLAELPYISRVDGGTLDLVRSLGARVVSSADLLQLAIARWDEPKVAQHDRAAQLVDQVKNEAFALVGERLRQGEAIDELAVGRFIDRRFAELGLATVYHPTVAAGPHSANPHYEPTPGSSRPIQRDEWLLIDLWARLDEPGSPFADVTWVAWTGPAPVPAPQRQVFEVVRGARDLALTRLKEAAAGGTTLQGWEVDRAVRDYIAGAGYGEYFTHRTGHNLGPEELHGSAGVCLDDFETHDTRRILPGVAFSVEPGIYLPDRFGVRLELNAVMTPEGPRVYTPVQREIISLLS